MIQRVTERVQALAVQTRSVDDLVKILQETLPLDAQRPADSEVWLAIVVASRTNGDLMPLTDEAHRGLRGCARTSSPCCGAGAPLSISR